MRRSAPSRQELTSDVADLLHDVNRIVRRRARDAAGPEGLTPSRMRALRVLADGGAPMMMSDLADRLGIARRSATTVVDELVAQAFVERRQAPEDRRAVLVALTPSGREALRAAARRRRSAAAEALAPLTEAQLRSLRDALRLVADGGRPPPAHRADAGSR